jgi:hypothetical protein
VIVDGRYVKILISQFNYGTERNNMEQEMTGQIPVEQQLKRTSEQDSFSTVRFIFRGENRSNPFMSILAEGLSSRMKVILTEIEPQRYEKAMLTEVSDYRASEWGASYSDSYLYGKDPENIEKKARVARLLLGEEPISGLVVVDNTMRNLVNAILPSGQTAIEAYQTLGDTETEEDIFELVNPLISELRNQGRKIAILNMNLRDHSYRDDYGNVISTLFNVPLIDVKEGKGVSVDNKYFLQGVEGDVLNSLSEKGLEPEQVVLLADHHLRYLPSETVEALGLNKVELALVCPCCINFSMDVTGDSGASEYMHQITALGMKLYPGVENKLRIEFATQSLLKMIEQKREELAKKGQ